jgi:hypothetical protein
MRPELAKKAYADTPTRRHADTPIRFSPLLL